MKFVNGIVKIAGEVSAILCVSGLGLISLFSESLAWELYAKLMNWIDEK